MLTWISEKGAKWVIYIFGAGIVIGLLSLGQTNLDSDRMTPVAKVNGKSVTMAEFKQAYEAALPGLIWVITFQSGSTRIRNTPWHLGQSCSSSEPGTALHSRLPHAGQKA